MGAGGAPQGKQEEEGKVLSIQIEAGLREGTAEAPLLLWSRPGWAGAVPKVLGHGAGGEGALGQATDAHRGPED